MNLASLEGFRKFVLLLDVQPGTHKVYFNHIRRLAEHYDRDPAELSEAQVLDYFIYLRQTKNYAPSTMKPAKAALRHFFEGFLRVDPSWKVFDDLVIRRRYQIPTVLDGEDVARLLQAIDEPRFHVFLTLVYNCGLRISEALAIEVRDIDAKSLRLHVRKGKGGKARYVPISMAMIKTLRAWWCSHKNPRLLFPYVGEEARRNTPDRARKMYQAMHTAIRPMSAKSVHKALRFGIARCGFKKRITVHTFRHCYATHLLEAGVNIRHISLYLGHASLNETLVYTHLTATGKKRTQEVLDGLFDELKLGTPPSKSSSKNTGRLT